jgi:hypothetical protein
MDKPELWPVMAIAVCEGLLHTMLQYYLSNKSPGNDITTSIIRLTGENSVFVAPLPWNERWTQTHFYHLQYQRVRVGTWNVRDFGEVLSRSSPQYWTQDKLIIFQLQRKWTWSRNPLRSPWHSRLRWQAFNMNFFGFASSLVVGSEAQLLVSIFLLVKVGDGRFAHGLNLKIRSNLESKIK